MHQRADVGVAVEVGDERPTAMLGVDDAAPAQRPQALAQGRARAAELGHQAPLGRQSLADLEHAVDDQPLDTLCDLVGHPLFLHGSSRCTGRTSWLSLLTIEAQGLSSMRLMPMAPGDTGRTS